MAFPYQSKPLNWDRASGGAISGSSSLGHRDPGAEEARSGTEVSGYVESPIEKRCGTCEYLKNGNLCRQETVLQDPEVPDDGDGLKVVDSENGCCNFWEAKSVGDVHSQREAQSGRPGEPNASAVGKRGTEAEEPGERPARVRLTFY